MTMTPWAMLMMSMTPKISVRPAAMSAYTPPVRTPSTIACRSAVDDIGPLLPGRLGIDGSGGARQPGRDRLHQGAILPLKGQGLLCGVLTERVERDRALD